ncbi:MAG: PHP-associated domain-containing protein [Anaerolineae bacterium]
MRIDMHIHTCASPDSLSKPERIVARAKRRGLEGLAITDHNTINMAHEMRLWCDIYIIVGEEIYTQTGEVIGLFLQERIAPGQTAQETAYQIHEQGGLVLLPHPYDSLRHSAMGSDAIEAFMAQVDVVEVLNARVIKASQNDLALELAQRYRKPMTAGSDAHLACEVGNAFIELQEFSDPSSFLLALGQAAIRGAVASPLVHAASTFARIFR